MAEDNIKYMVYNQMDAHGLLMNILGHDIIHDYGPKSSNSRWKRVDEIIYLFILNKDNFQTGGSDDNNKHLSNLSSDSSNDTSDEEGTEQTPPYDSLISSTSTSPISSHSSPQSSQSSVGRTSAEGSDTDDIDTKPLPFPQINTEDDNLLQVKDRPGTPYLKFNFKQLNEEQQSHEVNNNNNLSRHSSVGSSVGHTSDEEGSQTDEKLEDSSSKASDTDEKLEDSSSKASDTDETKKQSDDVNSNVHDTELTFDEVMDYIKQEIQITMFLYKMKNYFNTNNEQTGGDKSNSVFNIFTDTYKKFITWFINDSEPKDDDNIDENNDIYSLYNFMSNTRENKTTKLNYNEKIKHVELYNELFEEKFKSTEPSNNSVKLFNDYINDMNIPYSKEDFAIDAFINSDDHIVIVSELSQGVTRSGVTRSGRWFRGSNDESANNNTTPQIPMPNSDVVSSLRRSSRIRNNVIARNARDAAKAAAEEEKELKTASSSSAAAGAGEDTSNTPEKTKISSQTIVFRQQLIKFVAKTTLFLYGLDQVVASSSNNDIYSIERNILNKVVGDTNQNYDEVLKTNIEEYFNNDENIQKLNIQKLKLSDLCQQTKTSKYIINNATFLMNKDNDLNHVRRKEKIQDDIKNVIRAKSCVFCPVTSIIDAQSSCTFDKDKSLKEGVMEFGNMNFMIKSPDSKNIYYNGILKLRDGGKSNYQKIVDLSVTIKSPKLVMKNLKFTNLRLYGKSDGNNLLSASFVLQQALQGLFGFLMTQSDSVKQKIKPKSTDSTNYLDNLYDLATNKTNDVSFNYMGNPKFCGYTTDPNVNNLNALGVLFSKLIFKGCGDLFQEINAVCAYGGYVFGNPEYITYDNNQPVQQWKRRPNTQRLILSNDRPSAARAMIMLACATSGFNTSGQAGFLNNEGDMFAIKFKDVDSQNQQSLGKRKREGGATTRRRKSRRKRTTIKRKKLHKRRTRKQPRKHKRTRNRKT